MQLKGHPEECATNDDGPCTCGFEEAEEEVVLDEAAEFFE